MMHVRQAMGTTDNRDRQNAADQNKALDHGEMSAVE
jgi:hypothetical protein